MSDKSRQLEIEKSVDGQRRPVNDQVAVEEPLWQWVLTRLSPTMAEHYRRWPTL